MNRKEQLKRLLAFAESEYGLEVKLAGRKGDDAFGIEFGLFPNLSLSARTGALLLLSCNRRDIIAYLEGTLSDVEEAVISIDRGTREKNGCLERCPVFETCVCEGGCFRTLATRCSFCDIVGLRRICRLVDRSHTRITDPSVDWFAFYEERGLGDLYLKKTGGKRRAAEERGEEEKKAEKEEKNAPIKNDLFSTRPSARRPGKKTEDS